jgi:outer membrane protein TolC
MRLPLRKGLVALLVASGARAQDVTEKEFLSVLVGDAPAERALADDLARAEAAARRSRTLANPSLEFYREAPEDNPRVTNWTLGWTPPLDGRFHLAQEVADTGVAASRERMAAARVRLRTLWREAFASWSLAVAREDVLGNQLEHTRVLAIRERARASQGEVSGLSARRFALAEAEVLAALRQTQADRARAAAGARALRPDLPTEARPKAPKALDLPADSGAGPAGDAGAGDAVSTPELRAARLESEQASLEKKLAGRFWGFPELQLGWQTLSQPGLARSGPIFAVRWSVPLLDRSQAARAESVRREEIAAARAQLTAARVPAEIAGRRQAYLTLRESAKEADLAAAEGQRVIEAAAASWQAGEATLTDFLETSRAAMGAQLRAVDVRGSALLAHRELEAALGRPLSE